MWHSSFQLCVTPIFSRLCGILVFKSVWHNLVSKSLCLVFVVTSVCQALVRSFVRSFVQSVVSHAVSQSVSQSVIFCQLTERQRIIDYLIASFNNTGTMKFKTQLTITFFTVVNHNYIEPTNFQKQKPTSWIKILQSWHTNLTFSTRLSWTYNSWLQWMCLELQRSFVIESRIKLPNGPISWKICFACLKT